MSHDDIEMNVCSAKTQTQRVSWDRTLVTTHSTVSHISRKFMNSGSQTSVELTQNKQHRLKIHFLYQQLWTILKVTTVGETIADTSESYLWYIFIFCSLCVLVFLCISNFILLCFNPSLSGFCVLPNVWGQNSAASSHVSWKSPVCWCLFQRKFRGCISLQDAPSMSHKSRH